MGYLGTGRAAYVGSGVRRNRVCRRQCISCSSYKVQPVPVRRAFLFPTFEEAMHLQKTRPFLPPVTQFGCVSCLMRFVSGGPFGRDDI